MAAAVQVSLIVTMAARRSSEMTPLAYLSNGEVTSSTPGWASKRSTLASICFRIAAVRTLCPGGTTTISCAVVPLAWGNVRLSESRATWDSVPGRLNSSSNSPPSRPAAAPSTTSTVSQASSTARRLRAAARPRP